MTFAPSTIEEASEIMRDLAGRGSTLTFTGGGTKLGWGHPVSAAAELRSTGLNRVVDYAAEDLVVTVEAGMTLGALQTFLAPHKQRLAFDPPQADRATIGGLIATGDFGQRRMRYGSLRDLIIGVTFVGASGAIARGGGKVVKNVAGFDLPKLMVGSFGTLAFITSATFRLHPLPETARMIAVTDAGAPHLRALTKMILAEQLEPAVFLAVSGPGGYTAAAVFEGFAAGVDEQVERALRAAAAIGIAAAAVTPEERAVIHERHQAARSHGSLHVRIAVLPSLIEELEREAIAPLRASLSDAASAVYPSLGIAYVGGEPDDPAAAVAALRAARAAVERSGGSLVIRRAPDSVRAGFDAWGARPAAFALMERLKDRFDPERRLNRGRLVGGL
jgi:glycolate oxidase FAD binding subunit